MGRTLGLTLAVAIGIATTGIPTPRGARPAPKLVIGHRGASAYAPENTQRAYQIAIEQHADFVEPDLAVTRDRILICLHDDTLERTTDAATVFPDRYRRTDNGKKVWLANDFTLAEIKQLDAGSWLGPQFAGEAIPTWDELVTLARGRIGLYPEIKSSALYRARGIDVVHLLAAAIRTRGLDRPQSLGATPLVIQSFDEGAVRDLSRALPTINRSLLTLNDDDVDSDARLRAIAAFATGIGAERTLLARHPDVVARAHLYGLTVAGWTFADGDVTRFRSTRDEMDHYLYALGVDALFTNNPDQFPRR